MHRAPQKIGRNKPCPCGSGKKYKKCCGLLGQASKTTPASVLQPGKTVVVWHDDYDELDIITNEIVDLADAGRLDEAEAKCAELKRRWPDMIDWRDRYAIVYEARGDFALAAEHYRLAAEHAATNEGFDQDGIDFYRSRADQLEQRARERT